jgi:hypothetical protein
VGGYTGAHPGFTVTRVFPRPPALGQVDQSLKLKTRKLNNPVGEHMPVDKIVCAIEKKIKIQLEG